MKKCFRSLTAAVLTLAILLPLIPAIHAAESADAVYAAGTTVTEPHFAAVEQQIRAYAKSLNFAEADDKAAGALASHGITGGGRTLSVDENHALTATIWNSELFQMAATETCTKAIAYMQMLDKDSLPYVNGFCIWNDSDSTCGAYVCLVETHYSREDRDSTLFTSQYDGKRNSYDDALVWMAGVTAMKVSFRAQKITSDEITYSVTYTVWDRFDFDTSQGAGFNQLIAGLGALMFREFHWESTATFTLTVPYSCDHSTHMYHFTYDAGNRILTSDSADGYTPNPVTRLTYQEYAGETGPYYHKLDNPIRLYHNKPWVMEYTIRKFSHFVMAPLAKNSRLQMSFVNYSNSGLMLQEQIAVNDQITYNCYGVQYDEPLSSKATYTFRLENEIDAKGNNMIYLTILNAETQATVLTKSPMDDYCESAGGVLTLKDSATDYLNGVDLFISYIGNKNYSFRADYFDLRVWENGIDGGHDDCFAEQTVSPTCAAEGGIRHTCSLCGYSYLSDTVPALEHRMGSWQQVTAPTCTADGQEQRTCADCGFTENRVLPAAGHSYEPVVIPATCTAGGRTTYTCHCGDSFSDNEIAPLGHDVSLREIVTAPTCTQEGLEQLSCSRCSYSEVHTLPATGHRYEAVVTQPTCTKQGYTTYICRCGLSYVGDYTAATGHRYEAVITAPTCTTRGKVTQVCPCGMSYVSAHLPATGHSYENGICTGCGIGDPNAAALKVEAAESIAYTVSGNTVTVTHDVACKVGYLMDGAYVKIDAIANGDGSYRFEVPAGITNVLLVVSGDVNGDGKITGVDKGQLNAAVLGKVTLSAEGLFGADVSNDGRLTGADKGQLNAVILGKTAFGW